MDNPIRICVGTEPCTEIPRKVLRHTILKHAKSPESIEFHSLTDGPELAPIGSATGFSMQRWYVPEFCGYEGRAIYLDADQLVFADIRELWEIDQQYPNSETCAWCTYLRGFPQASVLLIDCEKARLQWPSLKETCDFILEQGEAERCNRYRWAMNGGLLKVLPQEITVYWNHLNEYTPGETRLLHYTRQSTQPWRNPEHPYTHLWKEQLLSAIRSGAVSKDEVLAACDASSPNPTHWKEVVMHPYWRGCMEEVT